MEESERTKSDNWDSHWEHFAAAASENPAQIYRHRILLDLLKDASEGTMRLLDLGSGQGDFLAKAASQLPAAELAGFELSEVGAEITRRKAPRAKVVAANLFAPPPEIGAFKNWATFAVCAEVLEHVDDPAAFLQAAADYLAPGATIFITVPGGPMSAFDRHIGHRQHFNRASISKVLKAAGFEVDRVCLAGFPFFNLYRLVVIARGNRLVDDVSISSQGAASPLARLTMAVFRGLFVANILDSPFGWQVVAVGRKPRP
jgi:2-polyprenyl-3-methyl-5-hydroxy-6-metoxy-1,4-benzoquinol methylase